MKKLIIVVFVLCSMFAKGQLDFTKGLKVDRKTMLYADSLNRVADSLLALDSTKIDYKKVFECYKKSSDLGCLVAKYNLAVMYYNGEYVKMDKKKTVQLFEELISSDYTEAKYFLAIMYMYGDGIDKDVYLAFELMKEAANEELEMAQYNLAEMYLYGYGTEKCKMSAERWLLAAAQNGNVKARELLKDIL